MRNDSLQRVDATALRNGVHCQRGLHRRLPFAREPPGREYRGEVRVLRDERGPRDRRLPGIPRLFGGVHRADPRTLVDNFRFVLDCFELYTTDQENECRWSCKPATTGSFDVSGGSGGDRGRSMSGSFIRVFAARGRRGTNASSTHSQSSDPNQPESNPLLAKKTPVRFVSVR